MNKQDLKPEDLLNELYRYFCASMSRNFNLTPKQVVHTEQVFQSLMKFIMDNKE